MNQTVSKSFLLYVLAAASIFSIAESSNVFERRDEEKLEDFDLRDPPSDSSDEGDSDFHRIVGGEESTPGEYPYFVELGGCGGALIAPDVVLFAAHCKDKFLNRQFNIGAYKTRSTQEGAQQRFCDEWIADPQYKQGGSSINNDFALCKLDHPVEMDSNISLELNEEDTVPSDGEDLIVMGFGHTTEGGSSSSYLRNVTVPYVSNEECNAPESYNGRVTDHMLCAGFPEGGKDACQGDSGGPIVKRRTNEDGTITDIHVGVVSWGTGCARENYFGVYARTSSRVDWIKSASCDEFNSVASWCTDRQPEPRCKGEDLEVDVMTDYYAYETTWQLEDTAGNILKYRKYRVSDSPSYTKMCLSYDTCYKWKINDSYGDGMCTSKGCGSYTVKKDGEIITSSTKPKFGKEATADFCTGPPPISEAPSQAPSSSPTEACGGNDSLKYQIQLQTDDFGDETIIATYMIDEDSNGVLVFQETNLESNTLYTFPSEESYQCLEDNRCYLFAIGDSNGDGMTAGEGAFFKGLIGGEEIFAGGADFTDYDERIFCIGDATLSPTVQPTASPTATPTSSPTANPTNPPTFSPTANPTFKPTPSPTANPTLNPTSAPTISPTASPTALEKDSLDESADEPADEEESAAPTSTPTASLTASPTSSPTANPTANPTAPVPVCHDDHSFRWKNLDKLNCKRYIRGNKAAKRCNKVWEGIPVSEWCAHSCGSKAALGACPNLYAERMARKAAKHKDHAFKHLFENR